MGQQDPGQYQVPQFPGVVQLVVRAEPALGVLVFPPVKVLPDRSFYSVVRTPPGASAMARPALPGGPWPTRLRGRPNTRSK